MAEKTPSPRADGLPVIKRQQPTVRTSAGLRDALFDEIDAFRRGQGDAQRAMAVSKLAAQILSAAKLEHDVAKYKGSEGYTASPLRLGSDTVEQE